MAFNRREFIHIMTMAAAAGMLPKSAYAMGSKQAQMAGDPSIYDVPMAKGAARVLHITDTHAQLKPIYFREPNVNLGVGPAYGRLPHIVGHKLLKKLGLKEGTQEAYAFTYLDFEDMGHKYGKVGGFAHLTTLLNKLRDAAGGKQNTVTLDGGDLWHGSATALWTRGQDMVEASNLAGVDIMTGHWEFTYHEDEVLRNISKFKGEFLAQNVRIKEDALMGDAYFDMVDKYDGIGLFDEDSARAFKPYTVREMNGHKVVIIGQAFPRTSNANPRANFPDWSFGLREDELKELVDEIQTNEKPNAIIMISHNGMDVDVKMAGRVPGIDAIFGGHTHDGMPVPIKVKRPDGGVCYVTNAGSNGKFVGVMDLHFSNGKVSSVDYKLLPVFSNLLEADKGVTDFLDRLYKTVYDKNINESRRKDAKYNKARLGKTYGEILSEELADAGDTLFRRGNFMGTWDQVIVNALREEHDTQIALSAGVRWGTSVLGGDKITMERVMDETSMTYGETYRSEMTGKQIRDMLEGVAENLFVVDPYLQSGGDMVRVGGMDYTIDPTEKLGRRISDMRLDDGTPVQDNKKYTVAGWAQVETVGEGRLLWDVVADHLRAMKGPLKLKKINHPTLKNVKDNPGLEDYPGELI